MADDETLRALESIQKKLEKIIHFKKAREQRTSYDTESEQNEISSQESAKLTPVNRNSDYSSNPRRESNGISSTFTNKMRNNHEVQTYSGMANVSRSESNWIENLNDMKNIRDRLHGLEKCISIQNKTEKSNLVTDKNNSNPTERNGTDKSKQAKIEGNKPSIPDIAQQKPSASNLNSKSKPINGKKSVSNKSENESETQPPSQPSANINGISDSSASSGSMESTSTESDKIVETDVPRNSFEDVHHESPYNFPTAPPKCKDYKNLEECKRDLEVKLQRLYEIKRAYYEDREDDIPYFNLDQFKNGVLIDEDIQDALVYHKDLHLNENDSDVEIPARRSSLANDEQTSSLNRTRESRTSVSTLIDKIIEKSENGTLENTLRNFQEKIDLLSYRKKRTSSRCSNPSSIFGEESFRFRNQSTDCLNIPTRSRDSSCSRMANLRFGEESSGYNEEHHRPINNLDIPERMRSLRSLRKC